MKNILAYLILSLLVINTAYVLIFSKYISESANSQDKLLQKLDKRLYSEGCWLRKPNEIEISTNEVE